MFCTCMIVVYYSHRKGKRLVMVKRFIGTRYELRLRKTEVLCEIDFTPIANCHRSDPCFSHPKNCDIWKLDLCEMSELSRSIRPTLSFLYRHASQTKKAPMPVRRSVDPEQDHAISLISIN